MHTDVSRTSFCLRTDDELIELLHVREDRLPREAVDEILRRADWMVGRLAAICADERAWRQTGPAFWAPVHAAYLLAAIGDVRVLRGLLAALRWSSRADVDWVWETVPSMIGPLGRSAMPPLTALILDPAAGELERTVAVHALAAVAAHWPVEQGEILDFLRSRTEDEEGNPAVRGAAALALMAFGRPGDRTAALGEALRQRWSDHAPLFDEDDVEEAFSRREPATEVYRQDWMAFYSPEATADRQRRWRREEEDARWARGAAAGASWVEERLSALLARYEASLEGLDDETRGEAMWVADSMTEYLVRHEGRAPWRWDGSAAFAYLMDAFARRVVLDSAGRLESVPGGMLGFIGFCAAEGLLTEEERQEAEARIEAERDDLLAASDTPVRRREAKAVLERLLARGVDPAAPEEKGTRFRRPDAPPAAGMTKGTGRRRKS
ncbi:MAG TPA: hypothetical protein VEJ18_12935 [Planctomycetota bacterium]|nr:hypothetical protein [Planctomycetota bacterium]